jgi:hypothetical protein
VDDETTFQSYKVTDTTLTAATEPRVATQVHIPSPTRGSVWTFNMSWISYQATV